MSGPVISAPAATVAPRADERAPAGVAYQFVSAIRFDPWLARVGALRAAYIAAFAKLGYKYIATKSLDSVRQQLLAPNERIIQGYWIDAAHDSRRLRNMALCSDPFSCLVVRVNGSAIILPPPFDGGTNGPIPFRHLRRLHRTESRCESHSSFAGREEWTWNSTRSRPDPATGRWRPRRTKAYTGGRMQKSARRQSRAKGGGGWNAPRSPSRDRETYGAFFFFSLG